MVWALQRKFGYRRLMQLIKFVSEAKNTLHFTLFSSPVSSLQYSKYILDIPLTITIRKLAQNNNFFSPFEYF